MSIEAMWQVNFGATPQGEVGFGAGVIVIETGRILGGDSSFYYLGTYSIAGDDVTCEIEVRRHAAGHPSVLGKDDSKLKLRAKLNDQTMLFVGTDAENPMVKFQAEIRRLAELP